MKPDAFLYFPGQEEHQNVALYHECDFNETLYNQSIRRIMINKRSNQMYTEIFDMINNNQK